MKIPFGKKHKGKEISDTPSEYLDWIASTIDTKDPKYGVKNYALVSACREELEKRAARGSYGPPAPAKELPTIQLQPKSQPELVAEVKAFIEDLYKKAAALQRLLDEHTENGIVTKSSQHTPF